MISIASRRMFRSIKTLLVAAIMLAATVTGQADESRYVTPNLLTSSGGGFFGDRSRDDEHSAALPIGFNFTFGGIVYSTVSMSTNGILFFGTPTDVFTNASLATRTGNPGVYALWDDLYVGNYLGTEDLSRALYFTAGSPGNRVFIMQWTNWYIYAEPYEVGTFNVVLHEGTNEIDIYYRNMLGTSTAHKYGTSATIGLVAPGGYVNQYSRDSPVATEGKFLTYTPSAGGSSPYTLREQTVTAGTTAGIQTYFLITSFSAPQSPIYLSTQPVTPNSTSATLTWNLDTAGVVPAFYYIRYATNPEFTGLIQTPDFAVPGTYVLTGLTPGTTYYWQVVSKAGTLETVSTSSSFVQASNSIPVATNGSLTTVLNTPGSGFMTATDADNTPNTSGIIYSIATPPNSGTVQITNSATGAYTYSPNSGFVGSDSFSFRAFDNTAYSVAATVAITVNGVPAITVEQPSGTALSYSPRSTVDFGSVGVAYASTKTFTIFNNGNANLTSAGVIIGGVHASEFTITTNPVFPVVPSESTSLTVSFSPNSTGPKTATLTIPTNDTTRNTFVVNLAGAGIPPPSNDAKLSALTISNGDLDPIFASGTTAYTATVPTATDSISVTPTTSNSNATLGVQINGGVYAPAQSAAANTLALAVGANVIRIKVIAQDNIATIIYTLTVTRLPSSNANLATLTTTAGSLSPAFASNVTDYSVQNVQNSTSSVTVRPTAADNTATIQVQLNSGALVPVGTGVASSPLHLLVGNNTITLKVTAQDGVTVRIYTIAVARAPSSNASLSALYVNAGRLTPAFSSGTTTYSLGIPYSNPPVGGSPFSVTPVLADLTATIQIKVDAGNFVAATTDNPFATAISTVGINASSVITIRVTAQDGTTVKDYGVTVRPSANLSSLVMSDGTLSPDFASSNTHYTSNVPFRTRSVTVTPTAKNSTAVIMAQVNGGSFVPVASGTPSASLPLNTGANVINIKVTEANGGAEDTYVIEVYRAPAVADIQIYDAATPAISRDGYCPSQSTIEISLNFPPLAGTVLTLINNTGSDFIHGAFLNFEQGRLVTLRFGSVDYYFVVNYYGGTGNDLVLQWAGTKVVAWGYNADGQLGDQTTQDSLKPIPLTQQGVLADKTVISVATGSNFSLALCSDGTLATWGKDHSVPVDISQTGVLAGRRVIAIATGGLHGLALCSDGLLAAWGSNTYGQLGNKSTIDSATPVQVTATGALANKTVVALAAGAHHNLALCSDGTLAAWGYNFYGQLGDGTNSDRNEPVLVDQSGVLAGNHVTSLAAGSNHTLAVCADGSLTAWGLNNQGQLGNSTLSLGTSLVPVRVDNGGVLAGKQVVAAAAGIEHSLALCSDRTMASWGGNGYGQLNNGNSNPLFQSPTSVDLSGALTGRSVTFITASLYHTSVFSADGAILSWGENGHGELGDNSSATRTSAVQLNSNGLGSGERFIALSRFSASSHGLGIVGTTGMPAAATVVTLAATNVTRTSGTLKGSINAGGTTRTVSFEYGTDLTYGTTIQSTPPTVTGNTATAVSASLTGLIPGTTYHFRVKVGSLHGNDATFTTLSDNADLQNLELPTGVFSPAFNSATLSYNVTVPNSSATVNLIPTAADPNAVIRVDTGVGLSSIVPSGSPSGNLSLNVGSNTIYVTVSASDGSKSKNYSLTVTRAMSSNGDLSNLIMTPGSLTPSFNFGTRTYNVRVPNTQKTIKITPTVAETAATIKIGFNGGAFVSINSGSASLAYNLLVGTNTVTLKMTAQDGTVVTYTITVLREQDATLRSIVIPGVVFPFNPTLSAPYFCTVPNSTRVTTVQPSLANPGCAIWLQIGLGAFVQLNAPFRSGDIPLNVGSNNIVVRVIAGDGSVKDYSWVITRLPSNNATLSRIGLSEGQIAFTAAITSYSLTVDFPVATIDVTPVVADPTATAQITTPTVVIGTPIQLAVGSNRIVITITAADGTKKTYTLNITRLVKDVILPSVTISAPALGAKVLEGNGVSVKGTATDARSIAGVEVAINGGAFNAAVTTIAASHLSATYAYTISSGIRGGTNTITVRSIDKAGNYSKLVSRSFTYVVMRPVVFVGSPIDGGLFSITPTLVQGKAQVGVSYKVIATPKATYFWDKWESADITIGDPLSPNFTFQMPDVGNGGISITGRFLFNRFIALAGAYNGLVLVEPGSTPSIRNTGFFHATVTGSTGAFTGKLTLGEVDTPLSGVLDKRTGVATFGSVTSNLAYSLTLDLNDPVTASGTQKITGTVTLRNAGVIQSVSNLNADRATFSSAHHAPSSVLSSSGTKPGVFTVAFPASASQAGLSANQYPQGSGFGTVTVGLDGTASFVGTLADGTVITASAPASAPLTKGLKWPLFASFSKRLGVLAGEVSFDSTQGDTDLSATGLTWIRPHTTTSQYYPLGWENGISLDMKGALYTAPIGAAALPGLTAAGPSGNALLTFSDGALIGLLRKDVNIDTASKVTPAGGPDTSYTVTLTPTSGLMKGSFTYSSSPLKNVNFNGVILQKGTLKGGYGFFLTPAPIVSDGTGESGKVTLFGK